MEARVAKLEADMEHVKKGVDRLETSVSGIQKSLSDMRVDISKGVGEINAGIATLKERSTRFTTRWDVAVMLGLAVSIIGGIIALAVRFIPHAP